MSGLDHLSANGVRSRTEHERTRANDGRSRVGITRVNGGVVALLADRRVRYVLSGGVAAVVYYGVFSGGWLLSRGHLPYPLMAVIANLVTAGSTYPLYRSVVFRTAGPWIAGFLKFYTICFWSLVFTIVGLWVLVELVGLWVLAAQAVLVVVSPLINYQLNRMWAFRA